MIVAETVTTVATGSPWALLPVDVKVMSSTETRGCEADEGGCGIEVWKVVAIELACESIPMLVDVERSDDVTDVAGRFEVDDVSVSWATVMEEEFWGFVPVLVSEDGGGNNSDWELPKGEDATVENGTTVVNDELCVFSSI